MAQRLATIVPPDYLSRHPIFSLELLFAGECHSVFRCVVSNSKSSNIFYHRYDIEERFPDELVGVYLLSSTVYSE